MDLHENRKMKVINTIAWAFVLSLILSFIAGIYLILKSTAILSAELHKGILMVLIPTVIITIINMGTKKK